MQVIKNFTDLNVWKEAHKLVIEIYNLTSSFPKVEMFGLTQQIRRSAVSVTSNIAEGFSRVTRKEKLMFYSISHGSLTELENQLMISRDVRYVTSEQYSKVHEQIDTVHRILNGFIKSTRSF